MEKKSLHIIIFMFSLFMALINEFLPGFFYELPWNALLSLSQTIVVIYIILLMGKFGLELYALLFDEKKGLKVLIITLLLLGLIVIILDYILQFHEIAWLIGLYIISLLSLIGIGFLSPAVIFVHIRIKLSKKRENQDLHNLYRFSHQNIDMTSSGIECSNCGKNHAISELVHVPYSVYF